MTAILHREQMRNGEMVTTDSTRPQT
jgi:hypothetical protein